MLLVFFVFATTLCLCFAQEDVRKILHEQYNTGVIRNKVLPRLAQTIPPEVVEAYKRVMESGGDERIGGSALGVVFVILGCLAIAFSLFFLLWKVSTKRGSIITLNHVLVCGVIGFFSGVLAVLIEVWLPLWLWTIVIVLTEGACVYKFVMTSSTRDKRPRLF